MFKWKAQMMEDLATVNNDSATNNNNTNNKEGKTMTMKERFEAMKAESKRKVLAASNKSGYGIGYNTRTIVNESKYAASKIKDAVCGTKVVEAFTNGYHNGTVNADYDFAQRCAEREQKARERANAKAAKAAADELFDDEFDDDEFDF